MINKKNTLFSSLICVILLMNSSRHKVHIEVFYLANARPTDGVIYLALRRIKRGAKESEAAVAVAYPRTPTSNAGNTNLGHSLACAIAAAVVGPPTLAFDAKYNSFGFIRKTPRPIPISMMKWINS